MALSVALPISMANAIAKASGFADPARMVLVSISCPSFAYADAAAAAVAAASATASDFASNAHSLFVWRGYRFLMFYQGCPVQWARAAARDEINTNKGGKNARSAV